MKRHTEAFNCPKIELHTHLGGSIRPTTFVELAETKNIDFDKVDFYNVNIETAFEFFKCSSAMIKDLVTLRRIVEELIEDYAKQNTVYLEIRSRPKPFAKAGPDCDKPVTKMDYIQAVIHEIQRQEEINSKIKVRYVVSMDRTLSVEEAKDTLALVVEAQKTNPGYIVGIELSGDPRAGSFDSLKPVFEEARKEHGLKVTLHCAETLD